MSIETAARASGSCRWSRDPECRTGFGARYCEVRRLKADIGRGRFLRCGTPEPATLSAPD